MPVSPGASGMQPRDPCRPWRGTLASGHKPRYDRTCFGRKEALAGRTPVLRFHSADEGQTIVRDMIRGAVTFENQQLDDLILMRSDGFPTYNFAVVVDDVTMKISHVIRGDDHLNNTPRQIQLRSEEHTSELQS